MEYGVEQLASAAGVAVDTIRFYQTRGLLPPPRRVGRRAIYGSEHLEVLKRIRQYQAEGLSLAVVKRLLAGETPQSAKEALLAAVAEQRGESTLTRAELAARSGVPEPLLTSLEAAGLLVPAQTDGEPRYGDADLRMLRAGLAVLAAGFPLPELLQLASRHAQHVEGLTDEAVALFDRYVRKVDAGGADPEQIAGVFRELLPAVTTLVALHFQRTLLRRALDRLRDQPEAAAAYEQAVQVLERGRLEVAWR